MKETLRKYDFTKSYQWNYDNAPDLPADFSARDVGGSERGHRFLGLKCRSPLGIAAGPLLNSAWILHYAALGFDILTYKTVRSRRRKCYSMPNLLPISGGQIDSPSHVQASQEMQGSWAISFGMPSQAPSDWMPDVRRTRDLLPSGKVLTVSVVATPEDGWRLERIADDYADVARRAAESGADSIEANFSCPNVSSADGQLFQDTTAARFVAQRIRAAIGDLPLVLKIGHITSADEARRLLEETAESISGVAMVNCIPATVEMPDGQLAFDSGRRGIGGVAIRDAVRRQVELFTGIAAELSLEIVAVGGVSSKADYDWLVSVGATSVQVATAAMLDPTLATKILGV